MLLKTVGNDNLSRRAHQDIRMIPKNTYLLLIQQNERLE